MTFRTQLRGDHWAQKVDQGDELYANTGEWQTVHRVYDQENDDYSERIVDATGKVVKECHEPLSKHRGHGSQRRTS
jgi:hypothetical protein